MFDPNNEENATIAKKSPVSWIEEICIKERVAPIYEFVDHQVALVAPHQYEAKLSVAGFQGTNYCVSEMAGTKQLAKHKAAIAMLNAMGFSEEDLCYMLASKRVPWKGAPSSDDDHDEVVGPANANDVNLNYRQDASHQPDNFHVAPFPVDCNFINANNPPSPRSYEQEPMQASAASPGYGLDQLNGIDTVSNYIGSLNEYCAKNSLNQPDFKTVRKTGPPHLPTFTMRCELQRREQDEPLFVELTKTDNTKAIKRQLAYLMLQKIEMNSGQNGFQGSPTKVDSQSRLLAENARLTEELRKLKLSSAGDTGRTTSPPLQPEESTSVDPQLREPQSSNGQQGSSTMQPESMVEQTARRSSGKATKKSYGLSPEDLRKQQLANIRESVHGWELHSNAFEFLETVVTSLQHIGIVVKLSFSDQRRDGEEYGYLRLTALNNNYNLTGSGFRPSDAKNASAKAALKKLSEIQ